MREMVLAIFLALVLALSPAAALAETEVFDDGSVGFATEPQIQYQVRPVTSAEFGEFVVGLAGKLSGDFFTNLWGNSTYDMDVRAMLHGYETVVFSNDYTFVPNTTAIASIDQQQNADGSKTYTLTVQPGLMYNNGAPIKAADYVFGLLLSGSPQAKALGGATSVVSHIRGYDEFNQAQTDVFSGLRLLDDQRFSITVKPECLPFFYELSMVQANPYPIYVIAPDCEVADDGNGAYIRNMDSRIAEPLFTAEILNQTLFAPEVGYRAHPTMSSGPYQLDSFDEETGEARFSINPYFAGDWRGQQPVIDNVVVKYYPPAEQVPALERGEVHLINKVVAGDDIQAGRNSDQTFVSYLYPRQGFGYISFSCEMGPTRFEAVRKALAYAINQQEFVGEYTQSYGMPVHGYYGIGQWMVQLIMLGGPGDEATDGELTGDVADDPWAGLSLDSLTQYQQDIDLARSLLIQDGWTMDESGEQFNEGVDALRYKRVDGELMPLTLRFAKQKDNPAADLAVLKLMEPMQSLGMQLEVIELTFGDLLNSYYRKGDRLFNMAYLATNFSSVFDPYYVFDTDEQYQGLINTSGLMDEQLAQSALELRQTQPGDLLGYCQRWIAFQNTFNDKLPMIPLYSNIYHDFSIEGLIDYDPSREANWPSALLYASLGEWIVVENGGAA